MKFCLLASSSSGNCGVVQAGSTTVLVDAGISARRTARALHELGLGDSVDAIFVSHEHSDHCRELAVVSQRFGCPIYATEATLAGASPYLRGGEELIPVQRGKALQLRDLEVVPFPVSHDAADPCGFTFDDGRRRVGVATDLGVWTPQVQEHLSRCRAVALEANHDLELLLTGRYPEHLKQRIRSPLGHLSNDEAGQALALLALQGGVRRVILAHLSDHNNRPELALGTVAHHLRAYEAPLEVLLSHKSAPSPLIAL